MKSISIKYFAQLRDQAGKDFEEIQVPCENYSELYELLKKQYQFTLPVNHIRVAINDEFSLLSQPLRDGDKIVFIPPVAGG